MAKITFSVDAKLPVEAVLMAAGHEGLDGYVTVMRSTRATIYMCCGRARLARTSV